MKKQNSKEVILTIVIGFLVLYYFFDKKWMFYTATILGILGIFSDFIADKITWVWLKIAEVMGKFMSPLILSIVFFVFLTPIAFLMKISKSGDSLKLKKLQGSAYDERNHTYEAKDLENTW